MTLDARVREANGEPRGALVLLHGRGADELDLFPLLDYFDPEEVVVVNRKDEASEYRRLTAAELDSWIDEYTLSELWEKNVFGGGPH